VVLHHGQSSLFTGDLITKVGGIATQEKPCYAMSEGNNGRAVDSTRETDWGDNGIGDIAIPILGTPAHLFIKSMEQFKSELYFAASEIIEN